MHGNITIVDGGQVRIHNYGAPSGGLLVNTQLIETPSRIIAVDAQFVLAYADEVVTYAKGLGKPIDRLIISHAHPDHYHGAARFGVPTHALQETIAEIVAAGDKTDLPTGTSISLADVTPTVEITPGPEIIDGIPFEFEKVTGGEIHTTLVVKLPEQGVLLAADVAYNHTHLWLQDRDFDGWQANIDRFAAETEYETIIPGHGTPAGPEIWAELTAYINASRELLGDDGDAYKRAITGRFPDYQGASLIDIANTFMFGSRSGRRAE
ncbi:MBL fold metallo-hydrolase [Streptomyces sp. NPDC054775]